VRFDGSGVTAEYFADDQETLELQWAQRWVDESSRRGGPTYTIAGRAPEPGDVLVRRANEPDAHLQITEAVDAHRLAMEGRRKLLSSAIWRATPDIRQLLSGVKLVISDGGAIVGLPDAASDAGAAYAKYFAGFLVHNANLIAALPVAVSESDWKTAILSDPASGVELHTAILRYAPADSSSPGKWLWSGPVRAIGGDDPDGSYISDAVLKKLRQYPLQHYPKNPLWLLVYTLDCHYDQLQEQLIQAEITSRGSPFERIFLFDGNSNYSRQLFPLTQGTDTIPREKPRWLILGHDCVPRNDDPRFVDIK